MNCQGCQVEASEQYFRPVEFNQNIGALVIRFPKKLRGNLCKSCINKYFWQYTITTFFLGWWGTISFFVTPYFLITNIIQYFKCTDLEDVPHRHIEQKF